MKRKIITSIFIIIEIFLFSLLISKPVKAAENGFFSEDITYDWRYETTTSELMGYGLFIPSTAQKTKNLPMIVSIHSYGGWAAGEEALYSAGLPGAIKKWDLKNFSAYILIPFLESYNDSWRTTDSVNKLQNLLDTIIDEYDIDPENIVICGESRGGTGALHMANYLPDYFSKCAVFSAYYSGPFKSSMPTLCFYSSYADSAGEYVRYLKAAYGAENVFANTSGHGSVGYTFLCEDGGQLSSRGIGVARKWVL